ncbi:uncharacterized protein LOC8264664 isoform X2 [Ricinus communis]|uniref:uncharacterized protein LOC8264664 isoform X2 n=1 Tax=Ricinus communis TaxID=3988 RepID=UPI0007722DF2|nr:uncharacterized protein LOC8264664 isoform X2 [Ricinus communis]|eukprot:XP_015572060.1 uncharacterized protein LOC8264664 isoform X2 [Ricinus communis]
MKLDSEQVLCHGTGDHKSISKSFGYNKIALDSSGLRSGNVIVNEDENGPFYDLKAREGVNVSIHDKEEEVRNFTSLKIESFDKDSVFYIDKNVMEPELPELVLCYKENTYHVVKDICVDEGVPSQENFLFDTSVDQEKLCPYLIPEKDIKSEIQKERVDLDMSTQYLSKNDNSFKCDSKESMAIAEIEDDAMEEIANYTSKETFSLGELLLMPEVVAELSHSKSLLNSTDEAEQLSIQRPSENIVLATASACEESKYATEQFLLVTPAVDPLVEESGHEEAKLGTLTSDSSPKASDHGHDEVILASLAPSYATEEPENGAKAAKSPSHTLDSVSDLNSSAPTASGGEEGSQVGGSEHLESRNSSRHEDTSITEPFSGQLQYSHGESSFSAAGPLSGLISYSGPIAYSGSLSLRSDSSTTSTRSFAFPILQSEWNSSPVRMAKADRRHFRKHRSWRQGLLCCRF